MDNLHLHGPGPRDPRNADRYASQHTRANLVYGFFDEDGNYVYPGWTRDETNPSSTNGWTNHVVESEGNINGRFVVRAPVVRGRWAPWHHVGKSELDWWEWQHIIGENEQGRLRIVARDVTINRDGIARRHNHHNYFVDSQLEEAVERSRQNYTAFEAKYDALYPPGRGNRPTIIISPRAIGQLLQYWPKADNMVGPVVPVILDAYLECREQEGEGRPATSIRGMPLYVERDFRFLTMVDGCPRCRRWMKDNCETECLQYQLNEGPQLLSQLLLGNCTNCGSVGTQNQRCYCASGQFLKWVFEDENGKHYPDPWTIARRFNERDAFLLVPKRTMDVDQWKINEYQYFYERAQALFYVNKRGPGYGIAGNRLMMFADVWENRQQHYAEWGKFGLFTFQAYEEYRLLWDQAVTENQVRQWALQVRPEQQAARPVGGGDAVDQVDMDFEEEDV